MTNKQYLRALKLLKLRRASRSTAKLFGLSVRQIQRYAAGTSKVPALLEWRLVDMLNRQGEGR